ncbi:hypothetical protein [Sphingobacterium sp.]|uniref:hypothetical protein n=1 Tax=Sphingobacterium sp. TaxID=341027 RepID=UPI002585FE3D|nr:hypothetical protein [Sphingobacterium sp.]WET67954.1 MAG: hypothetical protein P0Y57_19115 [Sphingobacterium sp.]
MANFWKQEGIPHKGWVLADVIDVREEGQPEWNTDYETCMMCGNEKIRYVHILEHSDVSSKFRVGCRCAEKMTSDYVNPEKRERELRNRASRRMNWKRKIWKRSKNGNYYLNVDDNHLLIYTDKKTNKFKVKIEETFGRKSFDKLEQAKIAAFNGIEYLKNTGEW